MKCFCICAEWMSSHEKIFGAQDEWGSGKSAASGILTDEMNIFMIIYWKWSAARTDNALTNIFFVWDLKVFGPSDPKLKQSSTEMDLETRSRNKSKCTLNSVMIPDRTEASRTPHRYWIFSFSPQRKELSFPLLLAFVLLLCSLTATNQIV